MSNTLDFDKLCKLYDNAKFPLQLQKEGKSAILEIWENFPAIRKELIKLREDNKKMVWLLNHADLKAGEISHEAMLLRQKINHLMVSVTGDKKICRSCGGFGTDPITHEPCKICSPDDSI